MGIGGFVKQGVAAFLPDALIVGGRGPAGAPAAVTFDDGPHPTNTPRILAALASAKVRATFFVQGQEAERYPTLVRDIHQAGHQVANHAYSHCDARRMAARDFVAEVARTQTLLCDIVQCQLPLDFRPPYGSLTPATFLTLKRRGFRFVFWSKDSHDSFVRDPAALISSVGNLGIAAGDIVLFHEDYEHTVRALPSILEALGNRSLRLGTTAELRGSR